MKAEYDKTHTPMQLPPVPEPPKQEEKHTYVPVTYNKETGEAKPDLTKIKPSINILTMEGN